MNNLYDIISQYIHTYQLSIRFGKRVCYRPSGNILSLGKCRNDLASTNWDSRGVVDIDALQAYESQAQLIKDDGFAYIDDIKTITKEYTLSANSIDRFIAERCEITGLENDYIVCRDLWSIHYSLGVMS